MQKFGICISLTYNDLLEISAVWRTFYYLCRQNMRFVENLLHSRALISGVNIFYHIFYFLQKYMVVVCWTIILFAECLFWRRCPFYLKKFITTELIFKVLPLCVFNHLFCCSRSYYCSIDFFRRQLGKVSCWCTKLFLFILTVLSLKKRFIQVVVIILVFFITNT